ncbi:MAG TPA: VWA domain-containing protein [Terriglobia bacterium]|nr:VWA domain-containing protein [Terriglobia bacterium]
MNLNRYRKSVSGLFRVACAILLAASLFANSLNQVQEKPYSLRVPVELVLVPVTVEDGDGRLIAGLQEEDFQLLEEGVPQPIIYFSSDPVPLSAVIMIDRSTDASTQSLLKETLLSLIESFSPFDEVAVFQFEHTTDKVQDFTANKDELLKAFEKVTLKGPAPGFGGGPFGGTGGEFSSETTVGGIPLETGKGKVPPPKTLNTHIHDAVFTAAQALRGRDRNRRGSIILISNGQNAPGNRHSYDRTMEALQQREITVFGIAQGAALLYRKLNTLSRYANPTGGAVFYPVKNSGFAETYQKITQMARNRYVLGFAPKEEIEKVMFRRLEVRLTDKAIKATRIRSRNGYYAIPTL